MFFDPIRATLMASEAELVALAERLASGDDNPDSSAEISREIHPTVAGLVEVATSPDRSVAIERFQSGEVAVLFAGWDRSGRAAITERTNEDEMAMTATHLSLLPSLLSQAVRLHPGTVAAENRVPLSTTAATIDAVLSAKEPSAKELSATDIPAVSDHLASVLGSLTHAWRASGSWRDAATDTSVTVLHAGPEGIWEVVSSATDASDSGIEATGVTLAPLTPKDALARLGDVVTGRQPAGGRDLAMADTVESGLAG